jgi:hypothetical protein
VKSKVYDSVLTPSPLPPVQKEQEANRAADLVKKLTTAYYEQAHLSTNKEVFELTRISTEPTFSPISFLLLTG